MTILGIDLGTTNSACGVWRDGAETLIPNSQGNFLTPSVVGVDGKTNILVGKTAANRLVTNPENNVAVFKRLMGTDHRVGLGKEKFTATELSSFVLRSLKNDAEAFLGEEISEAVISVPAYFNDNQRHATKLAGELAGLKVQRLINEPTAAAMAYGLHEKGEGIFVVLDMGGGTFDVSVIEYFDGVMEVHASAGDNFLGGEDFLEAMVVAFLDEHKIEREALSKQDMQRLYEVLEQAKRALSGPQPPCVEIELAENNISYEVSAGWFSRIVTPLLLRVRNPIEQAIRDADIQVTKIEEVLLVGGATRMAMFRNTVGRLFSRIPSSTLDPDLVVAMGAAVQAGLKEKDQSLDDIVLTDVCPYSLGTDIADAEDPTKIGFFLPLIERNTTVPTSHVETLYTVQDNQTAVQLGIYQGENRLVAKNVFLGAIDAKVPKNKAGRESVDVRFSYDMNGLLEVDVKVNSNGKTYKKVIEQSPGSLTGKELEKSHKRLAALKFHPREVEKNLELLSRGERLYLLHLGGTRTVIGKQLAAFENVLDRQNQREIDRAQQDFSMFLDQFDQEPLLP